MKGILQVFFAIFSSIITGLAIQNEFIPLGSPFLGLFALVPLYYAFTQAKSYREAGFLMGIQIACTNLISSFWLGYFRDFAIFTLGGTTLAYFIFGLVFGRFAYLPFAKNSEDTLQLESGFNPTIITKRILFFTAIWVIFEWFKSSGFLAYPWGTISMAAYNWSLITQIAAITGTYGITFLFALFSAIIGEGIYLWGISNKAIHKNTHNSYRYCGALTISLFLLTVIYGAYSIINQKAPIKNFCAVVIQQNADPWTSDEEECILKSQRLTTQAIAESPEKPDLVIWSEAILSRRMPRSDYYYKRFPSSSPLLKFIKNTNIPFVIGGPVEIEFFDRIRGANSALFFDEKGEYLDYYGKRWLVPFAEIIPYQQYPWMQRFMEKIAGFSNGWVPGDKINVFNFTTKMSQENIVFGTPICFEDAFPPIAREMFQAGAEVFVNLTNDSWSKTCASQYQHFVVASYRAIEFRTSMIRCANSGYSVVLDSTGRIINDMPLFQTEGQAFNVPVYKRSLTLYAALGNWLPVLLLILCCCYGILYGYKIIEVPELELFPTEKLLATATVSKTIFKKPLISLAILILCLSLPIATPWIKNTFGILTTLAVLTLIYSTKRYIFHSIEVTNQRIVISKGLLSIYQDHIPLTQIDSITTGKKSIKIRTISGEKYKFTKISNYSDFKKEFLTLFFSVKAKTDKC